MWQRPHAHISASPTDQMKTFFHLDQSELQTEPVPLFQGHNGPDQCESEQDAFNIALFDNVQALVQQLRARPTIFWIEGREDSARMKLLRQHDVRIFDLRNPGNDQLSHDTLMPSYNHPGPLTASNWARAMADC